MEPVFNEKAVSLASTVTRIINRTAFRAPVMLILILLSAFPSTSYSGHFAFRNIGMNEGLPSNRIYDLIKDSRDFYWAGTNAGLVKLYGDQIRIYGTDDGMPGLSVSALEEDGDSNLWLGIQGVGVVKFDGNTFNTIIPVDTVPLETILRLHYSKEHDMLLVGASNGFVSFSNGNIRSHLSGSSVIPENTGVVDFLDTGSFIYILTSISGLWKYYPGRDEPLVHIPGFHEISRYSSSYITSSGDTIWAPANREFIFHHGESGITRLDGMADIQNITEDGAGNLYFAATSTPFSELGGVFMVTGDTVRSLNCLYGLQVRSVNSIIYDPADDVVVIADNNLGMYILYPQVIENNPAGLPPPDDRHIRSFATTDDGTFWILDETELWYRKPGKDFQRFDITTLAFTYREFLDKEFPVKYSYLLDPEGSYDKYSKLREAGEYPYKNPYSRIQNNEEVIFPDHALYSPRLYEDLINTDYKPFRSLRPGIENSLWIMSNAGYFRLDAGGGIDFYDDYHTGRNGFLTLQNGTIVSHATHNMIIHRTSSLPGVTHVFSNFRQPAFSKIIQIPDGIIAGCRNNGFILLQERNITYMADHNSELLRSVTAMSEDSNGNILAGSNNGRIQILRIEGGSASIIHTIEPEGIITGTNINWIEADKHGFIWAGTNMGINRLRVETINGQDKVVARFFGMEYGIDELAVASSHVCPNGDIWIGGRELLARIDAERANKQKPEPRRVIIDRIDLDYMETDWHSIAGTNRWTNVPHSGVRLKHSQNNLSFYFRTMNIGNTGNTLNRYRVSGLNEQWSVFDHTKQVIYPNLPPGKYVLEVEAQLAWDIESRGLSRFEFRIMPPWWQTWWFYTLLVITIITLFWIVLISRVRFVKKLANRRLEQEREISELRIKALQAQMNPHFTFNAINSIQYYILNKDKDSAFLFISFFSKLIRQTLEFASRNSVSIKEEASFLENYLKLEQMRFEKKFKFKIEVDPLLNNHRQQIPPMLLQPFVENAILHGIMHKDGTGMITIQFKASSENVLQCIVEDDGVGRKRSAEINRGRHSNHKSIGLDITSRRLVLMNEAGRSDYRIEIKDLHEDDGNPAGTRVEINIPILSEVTADTEDWD